MPNTCPSTWNSQADEHTPFAKPVIGTRAPAPPQFASGAYRFSDVSTQLMRIKIMLHQAEASSLLNPKYCVQVFTMSCPIVHMMPPSINALSMFAERQ